MDKRIVDPAVASANPSQHLYRMRHVTSPSKTRRGRVRHLGSSSHRTYECSAIPYLACSSRPRRALCLLGSLWRDERVALEEEQIAKFWHQRVTSSVSTY